ncbi:MAG: RNA polymerase sigma factor [Gemmatimonadota bacterium]
MTDRIADFSDFYRRHAPDVFRFALYLSHDRSDAEDITSETFVRVWVSPTKIEAVTAKAYLFTIARNLHLRARQKQSRHDALDDDLRDPQPDPYALASARSDVAAVEERMTQLSPIDRAALLLRVVDVLPYEEIAMRLKISVSSAKVKVHRARLTLANIR